MNTATKRWKRSFIRSLTGSIAREIIEKIDQGKIPKEWDGHQLRWLLAEKFDRERSSRMRTDRKARQEYRNDVYNNNL